MRFSTLRIHRHTDGRRRAGRRNPPRVHRILRTSRLAIFAAVLLGSLSIGAAPALSAASKPASSTSPSSQYEFSAEPYTASGAQQRSDFSYELQPGHGLLDQVVVMNNSTSPQSFLVYGEDATPTSNTGGFAFQQRTQMHNTTVGRWITIGNTTLTVPAGKEVVDTFELSIPADATPGDHVGGVVVEEVKGPVQQSKPTGLNLVLRIAVPVYVHVVGKSYPGLTVENLKVIHQSPVIPYLSSAKVAVQFDLVNTGNDILDPKSATVSITGLLVGTIHQYTVHQTGAAESRANPLPSQMLPGGKVTLTEEWSGIPPFDPLTAHVSATATDPTTTLHVSTAASTLFWYFPWILVLIVLALIAALIVWRRRRAKAGALPSEEDGSGGSAPPPPLTSDSEALEEAGI